MHGYGQLYSYTAVVQIIVQGIYGDEAEAAGGGVGGRAAPRWRGRHGSWVGGGKARLRSPAYSSDFSRKTNKQYMP
jgi:hypothetical protein